MIRNAGFRLTATTNSDARAWDVGTWLRGLGLGQYEATFRENEIDETVLPKLTQENLKEIGVTALGHRLKLLDAITLLRGDATTKAPSSEAPSVRLSLLKTPLSVAKSR